MKPDRILTRALAVLAAFTVLASACGSADEVATTDVPATDVPTTEVSDDSVDPDETEATDGSSTNGSDGSDGDAEAPPVDEQLDDPNDPDDPDQDIDDVPPNEPGSTDNLGEDVVIADPPFEPAAADLAFCTTLDELNSRPQPETEAEMNAEIAALFAELRPVVPDEILADFDVLDAVVRQAAAGQLELDDAESDPAFVAATARIEEFVEVRCEGAEPSARPVSTPPVDVDDDPQLPDGLTIPVVPFASEATDIPSPYFGARADDGRSPADPEPGFDVASTDRGFCDAMSIINRRPQPDDEFEQIIVAQQYFRSIVPTVPAELSDAFDTILVWVDRLVTAGSFDAIDESTEGITTAVATVDEFVDARCLGR